SKEKSAYVYDDAGRRGGLADDARFVILGDMNADPNDGASQPGAIAQLLDHPRVNSGFVPKSGGATAAARRQGGANLAHKGDASADTADVADARDGDPGNLRIDYVLPSRAGLRVVNGGVNWPAPTDAHAELVGEGWPVVSSDHRLVWIDVEIVGGE
ncbi:MAG: endonuclease/exonuclease/phosphatase family protein, partial [Parvularculaceae bacterium]